MISRVALFSAAALALAGCRAREITSLQRMEAANVLSEAKFAVMMRDWKRAEGLYAKAADLCPDAGDSWLNLGMVRMHLDDRNGARSAYKSALSAYKADYDRDPANSQAMVRRAYVLVILGRTEEARAAVEKARSRRPEDWRLRSFVENHGVDGLLLDPGLKEITP
jgi:tetratricopeptide (TPR) repeat protein